jgi:hypothetical protein
VRFSGSAREGFRSLKPLLHLVKMVGGQMFINLGSWYLTLGKSA